MTILTLNGKIYSDDSNPATTLANGGHRTLLVPMLSDALADFQSKQTAAALSAAAADTAFGLATGQATAAAQSAASAVLAPGANATSSTPLTIAMGAVALVIQSGKLFNIGAQVMIASTASPINWMTGTVTSYVSATGALAATITNISGSAVGVSAWTISLSGAPGQTGVTNELKALPIASAANINLTAVTGNLVHVTGNVGITSITLGVGAERTVIFDGTPLLTHSAAFLLPGMRNIQVAAGDRMIVRGETAGAIAIDFIRANGLALASFLSTVTTITAATALTAANIAYHVVAMVAPGQSITLPDATTMGSPGGPKAMFRNVGGYAVGLRDSAGNLICAIAAGGVCTLALESIGAAIGPWSANGTNLEPGIVIVDSTLSSTYLGAILAQYVALDSNTSIHFAALASGSGFAAFVVDSAGRSVGVPVVLSTAVAAPLTCFKISSTSAIVFYLSATSGVVFAVVVSLSAGTALSVGAPVSQSIGVSNEDFINLPKFVQLSNTLYVAMSTSNFAAFSVSGATVSIGANTASSMASAQSIYPLSATTALAIFANSTSIYAAVISVAGTTCSIGAVVVAPTVTNSANMPFVFCQLSPTKFIVSISNGTVVAHVLTIAGTTVAWGAALTVEISVGNAVYGSTASGATRYNPNLFPLSATTALFWYTVAGVSRAMVLTEAAGVLSAGAVVYQSFSTAGAGSSGTGAVLPQGTAEFLALVQVGTAGAWKNLLVPHKINGTTITSGNLAEVPELDNSTGAKAIPAARLASGDYVLQCSNASALPVLRSNGDAINERGSVAIPNLAPVGSYPVAVIGANRIALTGGTGGGPTTQQLRIVIVEIAI